MAKRSVGDLYKIELEDAGVAKQQRNEHAASISQARELNREVGESGCVQCAKIAHFRAPKDVDKRWPMRYGYKNINVCSSGTRPFRDLSPMFLGPLRITDVDADGNKREYTAENIENAWQFSKVWSDDVEPAGDAAGVIKREWFTWRDRGWADRKAHRWPRGKHGTSTANRNRPLFVHCSGERLPYEEARKRLYIAWYEQLARASPAYAALDGLVKAGSNVQIVGYDGYDFHGERGDDGARRTLADCLADGSRPFGHELVLTAMLRDELVWTH